MSDQETEKLESLMQEVSELRQYKIDTERKLAAMAENLENMERTSGFLQEDHEKLRSLYDSLQKEYAALQEDKAGMERGILNLIKRMKDEAS